MCTVHRMSETQCLKHNVNDVKRTILEYAEEWIQNENE